MYAQKEENKMNGLDFIRAVKALAKEKKIEGYTSMKKAELLEKLA